MEDGEWFLYLGGSKLYCGSFKASVFSSQSYISPQDSPMATLDKMVNHDNSNMWSQGWLSSHTLDLNGEWAIMWDNYASSLNKRNIRFNDEPNELAWIFNQIRSSYSTKLGYVSLFQVEDGLFRWWWLKI